MKIGLDVDDNGWWYSQCDIKTISQKLQLQQILKSSSLNWKSIQIVFALCYWQRMRHQFIVIPLVTVVNYQVDSIAINLPPVITLNFVEGAPYMQKAWTRLTLGSVVILRWILTVVTWSTKTILNHHYETIVDSLCKSVPSNLPTEG